MGGKFEVDLEVLFSYYDRPSTLYGHVAELIADCQKSTHVESGSTSRVTGVAAAERATTQAQTGDSSMLSTPMAIEAELSAHMVNLRDSCLAYVKADDDGAQRLTAAAHPELATAGPTSATTAAAPQGGAGGASSKPLGW